MRTLSPAGRRLDRAALGACLGGAALLAGSSACPAGAQGTAGRIPELPRAQTGTRWPGFSIPRIRVEDLLLEQHRLLVEQGQRDSRSGTPPPRSLWQRPGNPIIQLPVATRSARSAASSSASPIAAKVLAVGPLPPPPCPPNDPLANPPDKTAALMMAFAEVTWHVCIRDNYRTSLWIGPVHMLRKNYSGWDKVIERAGLAEIFVPYHQVPFRPYDLKATYQLQKVEPRDLGPSGMLVQLTNEPVWPTVVAETRDRGIGWVCPWLPARRLKEFLIWGIVEGGNYDNIVEYGFRDDGTVTFRLGNTGYNSPPNAVQPHTHNALWYVDTDLTPTGTSQGESAYWLTHSESQAMAGSASDSVAPIASEGSRKWDELAFASLLVEDGSVNALGHKVGYEFSPLQNAISRNAGPLESWTQNDVHLTRARPSELGWVRNFTEPDNYLMTYLNGETVVGQDLAVWIKTAAHHHPNDEDRSYADLTTGGTTGVTLMHWSGFKMEPRNFFPHNPLGGPVRCGT